MTSDEKEEEKTENEDLTQRGAEAQSSQRREMREGGIKPPLQKQEEPKRARQAPPLQGDDLFGLETQEHRQECLCHIE